MAGRRNEGRSDAAPEADGSRGTRTDEERLTSLFGGSGEGERLPTMGAVEPSLEKAMEPFEYEREGDCGVGLGFRLESCEFEMADKRLIHEGLRVGSRAVASNSASWSLGA